MAREDAPSPAGEAGPQDSARRPASRPRPAFGRLARLCVKELREILRDRRTIITLVLMPLLVYPLLSMVFQKFLFTSLTSMSQLECIVATESEAEQEVLKWYLARGERILARARQRQPEPPPPRADLPGGLGGPQGEPKVVWQIGHNLATHVADGNIDVAVIVHGALSDEAQPATDDGAPRANGQAVFPPSFHCELIYRRDSPLGEAGVTYLQHRLQAVNDRFVQNILARLDNRLQLPVVLAERKVEKTASDFSLTTIVPLILILMTITGAVYPAIDLTAGERERGTLETLMAAPVPRLGLLVAKYVAVLTVALFTATANLAAMTATLVATGLGPLVFGDAGFSTTLVAQVMALLILFAAFFSAILLALTSFARSFKEAQAYLIPVMLLSLAPGIMSLMPDLQFNGPLAVTPLVNIVLLARDIFEGAVDPTLATAAVLSTALYAVAALTLAARIFGTDAILYGSETSWTDLWRRPGRRPYATVAGAMFCLALLFPVYFLLSNLLYRLASADMTLRLGLSALIMVALFVGIPLLAAVMQKVQIRSGFQLRGSSLLALVAAATLGISLWPFAHEVFLFNELLGVRSLDPEQIESVQSMLAGWRQVSPLWILAALAVTPAVCEEFFFRGYLLGALQRATGRWRAVAVSALLFGVFHVITTNLLATERFLPSAFLGLVLGWVCLRTGSIFPGMLLHALHNGLLLMIVYYRDELASRQWGIQEQSHMPALWLANAALGVTVGVALLLLSTRRRSAATSPPLASGEPAEHSA